MPLYVTSAIAEEIPFREAVTPSEKALDAIIHLQESEDDAVFYARQTPWRNVKKDERFKPFFSIELVAAWSKAERQAVRRNCQGKYIEGEDCGIEVHPILCAQDFSKEGYAYRTESSMKNAAVISYRWPQFPEVIATYRMILENERWVLDGVSCRQGPAFNMNSRVEAK